MFYHMFNDHVCKIDKTLFPTVLKKDSNIDELEKQKKREGMFNRHHSNGGDKGEAERRKKAQMTPFDQKQDDLDQILAMNEYFSANPWINRVAVVILPIIDMVQAPLLRSTFSFGRILICRFGSRLCVLVWRWCCICCHTESY
jgi:hypothetical protein